MQRLALPGEGRQAHAGNGAHPIIHPNDGLLQGEIGEQQAEARFCGDCQIKPGEVRRGRGRGWKGRAGGIARSSDAAAGAARGGRAAPAAGSLEVAPPAARGPRIERKHCAASSGAAQRSALCWVRGSLGGGLPRQVAIVKVRVRVALVGACCKGNSQQREQSATKHAVGRNGNPRGTKRAPEAVTLSARARNPEQVETPEPEIASASRDRASARSRNPER